jgi:hypothetical protein
MEIFTKITQETSNKKEQMMRERTQVIMLLNLTWWFGLPKIKKMFG